MAQPDLVSFVPDVTGAIRDPAVVRSSVPTEEKLWSLSNNGMMAWLSEKKANLFTSFTFVFHLTTF